MRYDLDPASMSTLIGTLCCHHMRHGEDPAKREHDKSGIGAEEFKLCVMKTCYKTDCYQTPCKASRFLVIQDKCL